MPHIPVATDDTADVSELGEESLDEVFTETNEIVGT